MNREDKEGNSSSKIVLREFGERDGLMESRSIKIIEKRLQSRKLIFSPFYVVIVNSSSFS